MHKFIHSFFDDPKLAKPAKKIWVKPDKNKTCISKLNPDLIGVFLKTTKKQYKCKLRYYAIENFDLYYFKSD